MRKTVHSTAFGVRVLGTFAALAFAGTLKAGTSVFNGAAVLEQATRATLSKNVAKEARFSSSDATAVLDWSLLNVPKDHTLGFDGSQTTFFNLVSASAGKSQIDGLIEGGGSVWVINPSGVAFGADAQVNVGGLFAVAAGNLSNEQAIRDGTALVPAFASLGGRVDVDAGARFTADQVALLGKGVAAAGDFTGAKQLTVGAAGKLLVDEVEGGRVSVTAADFADEPATTGALLGDLLVGDVAEGQNGGDLSVVSDRGVDVAGQVTVGGNVDILSHQGTVAVEKGAAVVSKSFCAPLVNIQAGVAENAPAGGQVAIDGTVAADAPQGFGFINIRAAEGAGTSGSLRVSETGRVSADDGAQLATGTGDLTIDGTVTTGYGLGLCTLSGNVSVGKTGVLHSRGTYAMWGYGGDVRIVSAQGADGEGDVVIAGRVYADGEGGWIGVQSAVGSRSVGDVAISGTLHSDGNLRVTAGRLLSSDDDAYVRASRLTVSGDVSADGWLDMTARMGSVELGDRAFLRAGDDVILRSTYGVSGDGRIDAGLSDLYCYGGVGDVTLGGVLQARSALFDAMDYASIGYVGSIAAANPGNAFSGTVGARGYDVSLAAGGDLTLGFVLAWGKLDVTASGSIGQAVGSKILNSWDEDGARMTSLTGDILLSGSDNDFFRLALSGRSALVFDQDGILFDDVRLTGDFGVYSTGSIAQWKGSSVFCAGEAVFKAPGNLVQFDSFDNLLNRVSGVGASVTFVDADGLTAGNISATGGGVALATSTGDIVVDRNATVAASGGGSVVMAAAMEDGSGDIRIDGTVRSSAAAVKGVAAGNENGHGNVIVSGQVEGATEVGLSARNGEIDVQDGAVVRATGADGLVWLATGVDAGERHGVTIRGTVEARGTGGHIQVGVVGQGAGDLDIAGALVADKGMLAAALGGDVHVAKSGTIDVLGADGRLRLFAGTEQDGDLEVSGRLTSGGTIEAMAVNGDVSFDGAAVARKEVDLYSAKKGVTVGRSAEVTATGEDGQVVVWSAQGEGGEGDVKLSGNVSAPNRGGDVFVLAGGAAEDRDPGRGGVSVDGQVTAGNQVNVAAWGGSVDLASRTRIRTTDDQGLVLVLSKAADGSRGGVTVDGEVASEGTDGAVVVKAVASANSRADVTVKGRVAADTVALVSQSPEDGSGRVRVAAKGEIRAESAARFRSDEDVVVDGAVGVSGEKGLVEIASACGAGKTGNVSLSGTVKAEGADSQVLVVSGTEAGTKGNVDVAGTLEANGDVLVYAGKGTASEGAVAVGGRIAATGSAALVAGNGDVAVNGEAGAASIVAWAEGGSVRFGEKGTLTARNAVRVVASGDIVQNGAVVETTGGRADAMAMKSALRAESIVLKSGGSVGLGETGHVVVKGRVFAVVDGHLRLAAGEGGDFLGGTAGAAPSVASVTTTARDVRGLKLSDKVVQLDPEFIGGQSGSWAIHINGVAVEDVHLEGMKVDGLKSDFGPLGENASLIADGDISVYTPGRLDPNGLFYAGGDIAVSAAAFGDLSYLRAGGILHVNTVGRPKSPLLAYFETVNGVTPKIDNQPNDAVIFVDGRLAGGNIQTMNRLGSHEAFPVETPELKSVQGVFGNPNFLHGELDVAEPVGIGVIDYLLVDRAKMSYGADIPPEMDMQVSVNGLSPLYSYWFGQAAAKKAGEAERRTRTGIVAD